MKGEDASRPPVCDDGGIDYEDSRSTFAQVEEKLPQIAQASESLQRMSFRATIGTSGHRKLVAMTRQAKLLLR